MIRIFVILKLTMGKSSVPVIVLSGPVGVGKTTVADAISEILRAKSIHHAVIDLDNLRYAFPRPSNDYFHSALGYKNLAAVWKNYKKVGVTCVIIPNVMEERTDIEHIKKAIPGAHVIVVRLQATLEIIHNRLKDREKSEKSLNWHLNRATQLHNQLAQSKVEDFVVDIGDKTPNVIAEEILLRSGLLSEA